jgi:2'-5' RNA ligase
VTAAFESGLVVPLPEADPLVGAYRRQHDPVAALGVPAHVTLLYPFRAPASAAAEIGALAELFAGVRAFEFAFTEVRRFPATVYLHPDAAERFRALTHTLVARWPDCPPYGGAFPDVVPHLTVADKVASDILDAVEHGVRGGLPLRCTASEAWLMCSDADGRWARTARFPFSPP